MASSTSFRVTFVCTGNICRSPMAEVVFRQLAQAAQLDSRITITSSGTGDWHVGEPADHRTLNALTQRGYDGSNHRARQFSTADFLENDMIIALDRTHERILKNWAGNDGDSEKIILLRSFVTTHDDDIDVPDPYYAEPEMFKHVLTMIEEACHELFRQLEPALRVTR